MHGNDCPEASGLFALRLSQPRFFQRLLVSVLTFIAEFECSAVFGPVVRSAAQDSQHIIREFQADLMPFRRTDRKVLRALFASGFADRRYRQAQGSGFLMQQAVWDDFERFLFFHALVFGVCLGNFNCTSF